MSAKSVILSLAAIFCAGGVATDPVRAADAPRANKKIVFLTGRQSHGWGGHSYTADCKLLAGMLNDKVPGVRAVVISGGWPKDVSLLDGAAAIVIACDGNGVLGPLDNYKTLDALARKGVGIGFIHYALDVGDKEMGRYLIDWIGGYYEQHWSVNPFWTADFKTLPDHPVARGVEPFKIADEFYYHMRFREGMKAVTPILSAVPPDSTRKGRDGPHSGNPAVRSRMGMAEHVAWAAEREDGGRGFGFTGGHIHWNYGHDQLRKVLLNAVCWIAKIDVPPGGVQTATPTAEQIEANLEGNRPEGWTRQTTQETIDKLNRR
jgi:type 1 glutamine amidotransferase